MVEEREEFERWLMQAEADFRTAKNSFESGDYYASIFWCQQVVEKGLKSVMIKRGEKLVKSHDLRRLGEKVSLSESFFEGIDELYDSYICSRYCVEEKLIPVESFGRDDAEKFIKLVEEVLLWIRKQI